MDDTAALTPPELANFLAAQAVASATRYIDGRGGGTELAEAAVVIQAKLETIAPDPRANAILVPTRLLLTSMIHTAISKSPRDARWANIMQALVELLRLESRELATGAQRQ